MTFIWFIFFFFNTFVLDSFLKVFPVSKSTWWAGVKSGRFPQSVKLSDRITAWRVEDIQELIQNGGNKDAS